MEASDFFLKLLVILLAAKLFAESASRLAIPSVLGEVVAGLVIGPSVLGFVAPETPLHLLAEIGILLLLFEVGLETDVGQLVKEGVRSTLVAVTGVVVPGAFGYWVSRYGFGMATIPALFVGGTIVATSIGITVRVLKDLNRHTGRMARIVLGAAVLDDVIGVVVLAVLYDFAVQGTVSIAATLRILVFILIFLILAPVIAKLFVPLLARLADSGRTKGMIPTLIVSLILGLAVISHRVGAPEILGSFAAGIALARRFFLPLGASIDHYSHRLAEQLEASMTPIIDLFVPVFFVMVGVSINLRAIDMTSGAFWGFAGVLTVVAVVSKMASGIWAPGGFREKLSTGIAMVPRGEVGLIFAEVGKRSAIFDDASYAVVVFVVALTTLLAPLAMRFMLREAAGRSRSDASPTAHGGRKEDHGSDLD
ncbi:MAG: cation:proton antiporter [Nitrospiraceae bacterium]|nr:cation:proton antiporter [Nitrospiraceae bacterium]